LSFSLNGISLDFISLRQPHAFIRNNRAHRHP
jgi:hypothetical protein